jgi:hypothetical protein
MPALKAKKLEKLPKEKVLLELCSRLANSIPPFFETNQARLRREMYGMTLVTNCGLPGIEAIWVNREKHYCEAAAFSLLLRGIYVHARAPALPDQFAASAA